MKQTLTALLLLLTLLSGCAAGGGAPAEASVASVTLSQYDTTFFSFFDTTTVLKGYAESEAAFRTQADLFAREMTAYHELFDIYNDYAGIANLKTVNDNAGVAAVAVDERLITFLHYCEEMYALTEGTVDVTLGPVLALWHDARENAIAFPERAALPEEEALAEALTHTGFDKLLIDDVAGTVYLSDSGARLDVGALGKGYAVQRSLEALPEGYLVSAGGNVAATGGKAATDERWVVGIRDPQSENRNTFVHTLYLTKGAVVSSGDYERYFTVDGVRYHHIIDRDTLYPAAYWRGVTVVCDDSGLADALSTAVFLMEYDKAKALLQAHGAEGLFVDAEGKLFYTDGFAAYIRT